MVRIEAVTGGLSCPRRSWLYLNPYPQRRWRPVRTVWRWSLSSTLPASACRRSRAGPCSRLSCRTICADISTIVDISASVQPTSSSMFTAFLRSPRKKMASSPRVVVAKGFLARNPGRRALPRLRGRHARLGRRVHCLSAALAGLGIQAGDPRTKSRVQMNSNRTGDELPFSPVCRPDRPRCARRAREVRGAAFT